MALLGVQHCNEALLVCLHPTSEAFPDPGEVNRWVHLCVKNASRLPFEVCSCRESRNSRVAFACANASIWLTAGLRRDYSSSSYVLGNSARSDGL